MRKYFLLAVIIIVAAQTAAQTSPNKTDSVLVFSLIDTAEIYFTASSYDTALLYTEKAVAISVQKKFRPGKAYALIERVDIYIDKDDLDKAGHVVAEVNQLGLLLKDSLITAISWMQMAQIKLYRDKFDEAIPLFEKSLQYYLTKNPNKYTALAYNDIGYCWGRKGNLDKQAEYLIKSISIYEAHFADRYGELGTAYGNLSTVYYNLDQKKKAIGYAKKSLEYKEKSGDISRIALGYCNICQLYTGTDNAEAEKYLQPCLKYALQSSLEQRILYSYSTASNLYSSLGKLNEAWEYELKTVSIMEKKGFSQGMLAQRYIALGTLCHQLKKDSLLALSYYDKCFQILQTRPDKMTFRDLYLHLSGYYSNTKNYPAAIENYKKYILYKDSIVTEKTQAAIAEIATRYETGKKDNEILKLNTSQRINQLEIDEQKAVIAGTIAASKQKQIEIALLSKSQEVRDITIKKQEEELAKQLLLGKANVQQQEISSKENQLQLKQLNNEKNMRNFFIVGILLLMMLAFSFFKRWQLKKKLEQQQSILDMRSHISQDLHDDIGASLSNINILNELARRNISKPEKSTEYLSKASSDIQRISESLSDIVWNISPNYDNMEQLFIRMKRYAADMLEGKNINGTLNFPIERTNFTMSMSQRRDLYLIFKEAVNNLAKYSGAQNAVIQITVDAHFIEMLVEDDGNGFDTSNPAYGNGLNNMKKRAAVSGTDFLLTSNPGKGTTVKLKMRVS